MVMKRAGKATEEEVLDGALALGRAYAWIDGWDECCPCYKRAKEGLVRLLREGSAKALDAASNI